MIMLALFLAIFAANLASDLTLQWVHWFRVRQQSKLFEADWKRLQRRLQQAEAEERQVQRVTN